MFIFAAVPASGNIDAEVNRLRLRYFRETGNPSFVSLPVMIPLSVFDNPLHEGRGRFPRAVRLAAPLRITGSVVRVATEAGQLLVAEVEPIAALDALRDLFPGERDGDHLLSEVRTAMELAAGRGFFLGWEGAGTRGGAADTHPDTGVGRPAGRSTAVELPTCRVSIEVTVLQIVPIAGSVGGWNALRWQEQFRLPARLGTTTSR